MRIDVVGKQLEITDAIRAHAETKASKLTRFFDGTQRIQVVLEELKHGEFEVEVVVDVEKHDDFIARGRGDDLYKCIDQAVEKAARQLTDFKERLKTGNR